jgi:hypothetical protein
MDLDEEDLRGLSNLELYDYRCQLKTRIADLRALKRAVEAELGTREPFRVGETVILPGQSMTWTPYDSTFAEIRAWCGSADEFLMVVHVDYPRVKSLVDLAMHRAQADGADEKTSKRFAQTVLDSLGSRTPEGPPVRFVPIDKAAKKWTALPDELEEQYGP